MRMVNPPSQRSNDGQANQHRGINATQLFKGSGVFCGYNIDLGLITLIKKGKVTVKPRIGQPP